MNRTITVGLAFGFVIVAALGASFISGQKEPAERKKTESTVKMVKSRTVVNEDLITRLEITGRLLARQKIELFAEVGGTMLPNGNRFKEGNYFKQGAALVRIDKEEQQLALLSQKSSLMNQITLMLPDLKTDYPESFPAWESFLQQLDVQKPLAALPKPVSEQVKYFIAARNLYNLYYSIQSQEKRLSKYVLRAPFNGVVSMSNIHEGTVIRIGQKLGEFMNDYAYELEAAVNEADIDLVKVGSQVMLTMTNATKNWQGTVLRISDVIDPATQTIKVFVKVSGRDLREGMYLNGTLLGKEISQAVEISRNLLVNQNQVYLVEDSALKLHQVEPVHFTSQKVIVKGIPDNKVILNEQIPGAYEGLKVGTYKED